MGALVVRDGRALTSWSGTAALLGGKAERLSFAVDVEVLDCECDDERDLLDLIPCLTGRGTGRLAMKRGASSCCNCRRSLFRITSRWSRRMRLIVW